MADKGDEDFGRMIGQLDTMIGGLDGGAGKKKKKDSSKKTSATKSSKKKSGKTKTKTSKKKSTKTSEKKSSKKGSVKKSSKKESVKKSGKKKSKKKKMTGGDSAAVDLLDNVAVHNSVAQADLAADLAIDRAAERAAERVAKRAVKNDLDVDVKDDVLDVQDGGASKKSKGSAKGAKRALPAKILALNAVKKLVREAFKKHSCDFTPKMGPLTKLAQELLKKHNVEGNDTEKIKKMVGSMDVDDMVKLYKKLEKQA